MSWPGSLRSTAAGSNISSSSRPSCGTPPIFGGHLRQRTFTEYIASAPNPSAHSSRVAATSPYTSPLSRPYFTFSSSSGAITHMNFGDRPVIFLSLKLQTTVSPAGNPSFLSGPAARSLEGMSVSCHTCARLTASARWADLTSLAASGVNAAVMKAIVAPVMKRQRRLTRRSAARSSPSPTAEVVQQESVRFRTSFARYVLLAAVTLTPLTLSAHGVARGDARFLQDLKGPAIGPLMYLGAKHMVTGYDHLLFLIGVIFFLYRMKDVIQYVSLFTIGHSVTLLAGVLGGIRANPYVVDAIIGLSGVYQAFANIDGLRRVFGWEPNTRAAVLVFGLVHGFGLATKLQEFDLPQNGLVTNIVSFNIGVEIGQLLVLACVLIALRYWREHPGFLRHALATNAVLMACGFVLVGYQLNGYASAATPASPLASADVSPPVQRVYKVDESTLTLKPREAFEYKYRMEPRAAMVSTWAATGKVKYEFHGDPDDPTLKVETYEKQEGDRASGALTAAFGGIHGWYFENPSDREVTIAVASAGFFTSAEEMRPKYDPVKHKDTIEYVPHELRTPRP